MLPGAILFDLYDTLVPGGTDAERDAVNAAVAGDLGVPAEAFARLYRATMADRFTGRLGDLEATLRDLAGRLGGSPGPAALRTAAARRTAFTAELLAHGEAAVPVLDRLRRAGWALALVTNASAETPALWPGTVLAQRFDHTVFSCRLGAAKPDHRAYQAALRGVGCAPAGSVFVGDGAGGELAGARAVGLAAVQVVHRAAAGRPPVPWTGPHLGDLAELPGHLEARPPREARPGPDA